MPKNNRWLVWASFSAITAGLISLVPLIFYFYFIPASGSSPTHVLNPASFLPWMAKHASIRITLWWTIALAFFIALLSLPLGLKKKLEGLSPFACQVAEVAGLLGLSAILIASLMLAAGEAPLARAYVNAGQDAQPAIIATYQWQQLVTAIIFDVLGFFSVGVWLLITSLCGLISKALPKGISWFGLTTSLATFSCAIGYACDIKWLGELGIGKIAFIMLPAWMIWLGIIFLKDYRRVKKY